MSISRSLLAATTLGSAVLLSGCGYNDFQRLDEEVKGGWAEVLNQYQRRSDLIPNIVATVKGEANFEQETLTRVIEARAKASSIQLTPQMLEDPQATLGILVGLFGDDEIAVGSPVGPADPAA